MAELLNNYIIGLGGTGGKSVAAFRRAVALREQEATALQEKGVRFQYLYIDSNDLDINAAAQGGGGIWYVPGKNNLCLSAGERLLIDGGNMSLRAAHDLQNIRPWFGDDSGVGDISGTVQGAAQRRRYGRMLLARRAQDVCNILQNGVQSLTSGSEKPQSLTFHIFATLGGGTGSGSIVDLVTYLYSLKTDPRPEIILYLYVGGDDVRTANAGFFYQNEYAALRDLNALMCERYEPEIALVQSGKSTHRAGNPVLAAYVSSEDSDTKYKLSEQVERMAASCLDMISFMHSPGADSDAARALTGEDLVANNPGECCDTTTWESTRQIPPTRGDRAERSYRFQTIGVSRCKEPVREIRTVLRSVLAEEVYDCWLRGQKNSQGEAHHVTDVDCNTDIYSRGYFSGAGALAVQLAQYEDRIHSTFKQKYDPSEVDELIPSQLRLMREDVAKLIQTVKLDTEQQTPEKQDVPTPMQQWCRAEADIQMQRIEDALKKKRTWRNTATSNEEIWGVEDIVQYLDNLSNTLREAKSTSFKTDLGQLETREKEWRKITPLTSLLSKKKEQLYELHFKECCSLLERALNERRASILSFMEKQLADKVDLLLRQMRKLKTALEQQKKKYAEEHTAMYEVLSKSVTGDVIIFDEKRLNNHIAEVRAARVDITFALTRFEALTPPQSKLVDSIPYQSSSLDDTSAELSFWSESRRIHDDLVKTLKCQPAYHASIYEALADISPDERKKKYKDLLHNIHTLARCGENARDANRLSVLEIPSPAYAIAAGLPAHINGHDNEARKVEGEIRQMLQQDISPQPTAGKNATYVSGDSHEIRIMACYYWMPVRMLSVMGYVDKAYHSSLKSENEDERKMILFFTNIDDKEGKPELIPTQVYGCKLLLEVARHLLMSGGEVVAKVSRDGSIRVCEPRAMQQELVKYANFAPIYLSRGDADLEAALKAAIEQWLKQHDKAPVLEAMRAEHRAGTAADNDFLYAAIEKLEKWA